MRLPCASAAALALVALCSCASAPSPRGPGGKETHPLLGKAAPLVDGAGVVGTERVSSQHAGEVVVVDFWSSYCGPCVKEFPQLQALQDRHGGKVHVVGVSEDEDPATIPPFLARTGVRFPITWDRDKLLGGQYSVGSMPQTFVLDRAGVIRFVHQGYHAGEADELEREVTELLGPLSFRDESLATTGRRALGRSGPQRSDDGGSRMPRAKSHAPARHEPRADPLGVAHRRVCAGASPALP